MFKKIFIELCSKNNESPSSVCAKIGITPAAFSQWTESTIPRKVTLHRAADYFGVSVDYLLGKEETLPEGELKDMIIVRHRDGRRKERELTPEQIAMIDAMINAIPDEDSKL